ncbi:hypothetical protein R4064_10395 [Micrococcus yunnanensis]|uniref:Uncharacterized protein n=1 Tax=Micrococcus yunnanensis TaxID=566027 RepID=A0AAP5T9H2_9MICC|nr:hypothetical protein [Micrococcus yunnanensis]MDV7178030.1 hypothetical protein [Micrococcus yunnanensis]
MNKLMQQYLILRAWIQDKHDDEAGAETIEIILGVLAAVVLAALVWAGINTFATNKVGELG